LGQADARDGPEEAHVSGPLRSAALG
jgi:hypothetical protein